MRPLFARRCFPIGTPLRRSTSRNALLVLSIFAAGAAGTACDRAPSSEGLKEWKASDHDGEKRTVPNANQGPRTAEGGGVALLVDTAWRNQCLSCHGPAGHGDGPQGVMYKAADLSREEWQAKATDDEIAATITNGRNRMPKFDLPEPILKGLVQRIRSFRGR